MNFIPACVTASALCFTGGVCAFTGYMLPENAAWFLLAALVVILTISRLPR